LATTKDARARYVVLKVPGSVPAPACPDLPAGSGTRVSLRRRHRARSRGPTPLATEGSPSRTLPQNSTVCATGMPERFSVPIPRSERSRAVLGERPTFGRVASDRPWSSQAVRAWLPGGPRCEDRVCSLERR